MITAYVNGNGHLRPLPLSSGEALPENAVWIDLHNPKPQEETVLEGALHIDIPTREEMREIEVSSRLYQENGGIYMTASVAHRTETEAPEIEPVTFILSGRRLVTIRYADPAPFQIFATQARRASACLSGEAVLAELLEAIIDRIADTLERVQHDVNQASRTVFARQKADFEEVLRKIGHAQGIIARVRESLASINRLLIFLSRTTDNKPNKGLGRSSKTLTRDVISLSDHASFLANNINFLLDATLGMINIEQTEIIKIFSVAAMVFLPPTLIASVYGMNFKSMPELDWFYGYPLSIGLMVLSAILPYLYFKRRGWL
jgi:magnesium transporter